MELNRRFYNELDEIISNECSLRKKQSTQNVLPTKNQSSHVNVRALNKQTKSERPEELYLSMKNHNKKGFMSTAKKSHNIIDYKIKNGQSRTYTQKKMNQVDMDTLSYGFSERKHRKSK